MKYLLLFSFIIFCFHFSYSQDLDLNKTDIKLEEKRDTVKRISVIKLEEKRDTVKRISVKINYSYFSGLDIYKPEINNPKPDLSYPFLFNDQDKTNESKSGIISLSLHYKKNKWKYGLGMNYSNYNISYRIPGDIYYSIDPIYSIDYNYNLNRSHKISTCFVTLEKFLNKNLYLGLHLGANFIKTENKYVYYSETVFPAISNDIYVSEENYQETFYQILPYTKFCVGYQFKLYNQLNFNLELGVGGSMTNTGVSYLFR